MSLQLGKLVLHDEGRKDFSKEQWALVFEDYFREFETVPVYRMEMAVTWIMRNGGGWFPSIWKIHQALKESEKEWMAN